MTTFSVRNGFSTTPLISFRYEAPENLRHAVLSPMRNTMSSYNSLRATLCDLFLAAPDLSNWTEVPNIRDEVHQLLFSVEWYQFYDAVEHIATWLLNIHCRDQFWVYQREINSIFLRVGAGWQIDNTGRVVVRGDEGFEASYQSAVTVLSEDQFAVPRNQLVEARADISRRPVPDLTGAVHHATGAIESLARIQTGKNRSLGELVQALALTPPLNEVVSKIWGYSSNYGRHISPEKIPTFGEASFIVHSAGAICEYIISNIKN